MPPICASSQLICQAREATDNPLQVSVFLLLEHLRSVLCDRRHTFCWVRPSSPDAWTVMKVHTALRVTERSIVHVWLAD